MSQKGKQIFTSVWNIYNIYAAFHMLKLCAKVFQIATSNLTVVINITVVIYTML